MNISYLATTAARRIGLLFIVLPAALGTANGGVIGFTKIADGSDGLSRFSAPSINEHGVAAFRANLTSGDQALFRGAGGPLTEIAREATHRISNPFRDFRIADEGSVVYRQRTSSTNTEGDLIVSDGSDSLKLETAKFHDLGSVTAAGDVVFERAAGANSSAGQSIVVRSLDGSESRGVASNNLTGGREASVWRPDINDSGTVIFGASQNAGDGTLLINGSEVNLSDLESSVVLLAATERDFSTVAYRSQQLTFEARIDSFLADPSLNNDGEVAFFSRLNHDRFSDRLDAILLGDVSGKTPTVLVDSLGPFDSLFGTPDLNDHGKLAFFARLDNGRPGIFTGPDPVADKVIARGDTLFGGTVEFLKFDRGLNNRNELAFQYRLEDGTGGVAIAQLEPPPTAAVPEPASLVVWCLAALGLVSWMRYGRSPRGSAKGAASVA